MTHAQPVTDRFARVLAACRTVVKVNTVVPRGKIPKTVDIRRLALGHEIMRQQAAHPCIAGFRIACQPDDAMQIIHSSTQTFSWRVYWFAEFSAPIPALDHFATGHFPPWQKTPCFLGTSLQTPCLPPAFS